jgi:uncharacterized protein
MTSEVLFYLMAAIASLIVGMSKGGLQMIGILAVPIMSLAMSPVMAAGLLLPIYIISDVYGLWIYRKEFNPRNIAIIVPAAVIGIGFGWATAKYTNDDMVKILVGVIGLAYCVDALLKAKRNLPPKPADVPRGLFWGTLAGFTSFVSHAGGPPYQMYVLPQRLDKMTYAGTTTIIFAIINLLKLPPYWFLGQINATSLEQALYLAPVAIIGAYVGYRLTRIIPQGPFFRLVELALFLVSIKLIYDGVVGLATA